MDKTPSEDALSAQKKALSLHTLQQAMLTARPFERSKHLTTLNALLARTTTARETFDANSQAVDDAFAKAEQTMDKYKETLAREREGNEEVRREVRERIRVVEGVVKAEGEERVERGR